MSEISFADFLSAIRLPGAQPVAEGDVYSDARICAARAIHEARRGRGKAVVLIQADNEGLARTCAKFISALFLDEPLLTKELKQQRVDEFTLRNGRVIVVTSMARSPVGLIVTLKLTVGAAEPEMKVDASNMTDGEKLSLIGHALNVAFVKGRAAGEVLDEGAIKLLLTMDADTPTDPKEAFVYLSDMFDRISVAHDEERAARYDSGSASGSITPSGSLDWARSVMTPTSVPSVPRAMTREEYVASEEFEQQRAARMGVTPRRQQTKAIT